MISATGRRPPDDPKGGPDRAETTSPAGFTLLELLIVMSILVVMASLAFPDMKRMVERVRFQSGVARFHAVLVSLQDRSLWEQRVFHLFIDPDRNEYRTYEHDGERQAVVYSVGNSVRIGSDKAEILFYPDGSIDPARISLTDNQEGSTTFVTQGVFGGIRMQSN